MKQFIIITFLSLAFGAFSQNEVSTVYFGTTLLDFRFSPFQVLSSNAVFSFESAASICDENGNLLFYSNGGKLVTSTSSVGGVWGADGQYLLNGDHMDSMGCSSSNQGAIVIPDPAGITPTSKKYFLLTRDCIESAVNQNPDNSGFSYAIIDMLANGGSGAVVSRNNVVVPYGNTTSHSPDNEPITVVWDSDEGNKSGTAGYWIFSYKADTLYRIHFGVNGFDSYHQFFHEGGKIIVSPDRKHLMIRGHLYDLDATTGDLQLVHSFPITTHGAFSSDGRKIYRIENKKLNQYDLDLVNWQNNPTELASFSQSESYSLCLVPNGRILLLSYQANSVSGQIVCPNNPGTACGYDPTDIFLQGGIMGSGAPNIPAHYLYAASTNCSLGLDENDRPLLSIHPNPATNTVFINGLENETTYVIYSSLGQVISQGETSGQNPIDIRYLEQGTYLIQMENQFLPFIKTN